MAEKQIDTKTKKINEIAMMTKSGKEKDGDDSKIMMTMMMMKNKSEKKNVLFNKNTD